MSTDWKALCEELIALVERCPVTSDTDWIAERNELIVWFHSIRRAALAAEADGPASVVGEPGDEEIMGLMPQQMRDDLAAAVRAMAKQEGIDSTRAKGVMRIMLNRHVVDLARAVLARYGHQPAPPAEGEEEELVRWLGVIAADAEAADFVSDATKLTRIAAALLEQRHPVPMAVSERLPGPEDCDGEGRCWWLHVGEDGVGDWFQRAPYPSITSYAFFRMTHWLPATALPLPQGEVQP